jgi:uncharacterized protein YrrD
MHARELRGRAIVTLSDAAKVGTVDDVLFDAAYKVVLGFRVKRGAFSQPEAILRDNVQSVGRDAITIPAPDSINSPSRLAALTGATTESQARGTKIVSENGDFLGTVSDLEIDDVARIVTGYALSAPLLDRLRHREQEIDAHVALRLGAC